MDSREAWRADTHVYPFLFSFCMDGKMLQMPSCIPRYVQSILPTTRMANRSTKKGGCDKATCRDEKERTARGGKQ